ncbi:alpha-1,3-galactosyltransferase 2 [Protopterus annectens]|uniref:alpha-1,3-galactosyltransferase 2 n=1 Tax=Protopterus annectens TaxID=7888 RepID=UPI001CFAFBE7|nr:alpha-1,3-galactosyltransferase 2 [Protopterus annectens]
MMRYVKRSKKKFVILCLLIIVSVLSPYFITIVRYMEGLLPMDMCNLPHGGHLQLGSHVENSLDLWSRADVQTCTYWGAPIIWERTFDPQYYDEEYAKQNVTIGLTVFAVGKYLDMYLKLFLTTAEMHFMVGHNVIYYVFTDMPQNVPKVHLAKKRQLRILQVERHSRWQDISMMRMKFINQAIHNFISYEVQYVFCMDVDQYFQGRFGVETLSSSVALLHSWYYRRFKFLYSYDHNPKSTAFLAQEEGDFYYHAAVFGGKWESVKNITEFCYQGILQDKLNNVEALWHDESHLNKYFWQHKPTKVLSPEYCWDKNIGFRKDIWLHRLTWAKKQYSMVR